MFIEGFHKTAAPGLLFRVSRTLTRPIGKGREARKILFRKLRGVKKSVVEGIHQGITPIRKSPAGQMKKEIGQQIGTRQHAAETAGKVMSPEHKEFLKDVTTEKAREKVIERAKKMKGYKGPSFAARHPILTAGGTMLAFKALSGDDKEDRGPQVYYGGAPAGAYSN